MKLHKDMNALEKFLLYFNNVIKPPKANKLLVSETLLEDGLGEALALNRSAGKWKGEWGGYTIESRPDAEFVYDKWLDTSTKASTK